MEFFLLPLGLVFLVAPILAIVAIVLTSRLSSGVEAIEREVAYVRRSMTRARPAPEQPEVAWASPPSPAPMATAVPPVLATGEIPKGALFPPQPGPPPSSGSVLPPRPMGPGIEEVIGTRWLNVAGIITLLFGVAFFLKYA